jgi:glutathione S-transferase
MSPPVPADLPVLHTFLGGKGPGGERVASYSPFCLKAEAALRMGEIAFTPKLPTGPPRNRTGKLPCLALPGGALIEGSDAIVRWMAEDRGVDLDAALGPDERRLSFAARRVVEEHLYWGVIQDRWLDDKGFSGTRRDYFRGLPAPLRAIVPPILRSRIRRDAHGQGLSRMDPAQRRQRLTEDLDLLDGILGDKDWMFASGPSALDAVVYGIVMNVVAGPAPGLVAELIGARPRLGAHSRRLHARWFVPPLTSA